MDITVVDISTSHRLPGRRVAGSGVNQTRGGKIIIAKFVRRDVKVQLMRSKKKLKSCDAFTKVFVDEYLTPLRSKMFRELRTPASGVPGQ